ncbi:MAG TPA: ester cyclase [Steroidobacteraceae bacterium]|nr:ester cyclase [Steroidobacteraceae bacterium]
MKNTTAILTALVPLLLMAMAAVGEVTQQEAMNIAIVEQATKSLNRHELDRYVSYFAAGAERLGQSAGHEGVREHITDIYATFPDYSHEILDTVAQGEWVVVRCRVSGTHRGVAKLPLNGGMLVGVPPTQKHFDVLQSHWYKIQDGKIVEHTSYRDDLGMMRQLGLLPRTGLPK